LVSITSQAIKEMLIIQLITESLLLEEDMIKKGYFIIFSIQKQVMKILEQIQIINLEYLTMKKLLEKVQEVKKIIQSQ
jgi:hypothetical protein